MSALCILFGGVQFKEGTDFWSLNTQGIMPPPYFGMYFSFDRFTQILRYWAFGPDETADL